MGRARWGTVRDALNACAWTFLIIFWVENYAIATVQHQAVKDEAFGDASQYVKVHHGANGHNRRPHAVFRPGQPISEEKRRDIMRNLIMQKRAYSIMDSSRVSTFLISILLIVYGSFRSLNMEQEAKERELEKEKERSGSGGGGESNVQTLDAVQAMCLPLGASVSLLVMFFFFDSMQMLFAICTAIIATVALAFLLLPMCQYILRPCTSGNKMSFGACGRFTAAEMVSFGLALSIVAVWVLTGHWLLMDAMGMGLCVAFIAFVRLPSLKVSTLLLTGLLLYDVFWVFFSSYIFNANVMVRVATRPAENPVGLVAKKLHLNGLVRDAPKLSLPGKLVFPSMNHSGHFSMLGLGDIVMPGLLLCFVMRYDAYKRAQVIQQWQAQGVDIKDGTGPGALPPFSRMSYFHCSLIGYFLGLLTATVSSEVFKAAQPALLYLVPFTLLPLLTMAYLKGDLRRMWSEPFIPTTISGKHQVV